MVVIRIGTPRTGSPKARGMERALTFIGFGEAGQAFAGHTPARGYDRKTGDAAARAAKLADFERANVQACETPRGALAKAEAVLSVVTADQALAAAEAYSPCLQPGALWFDCNSVAPGTKRSAARAVEAAGGRYVDVAVMAPVRPKRLATPLLVAGPHADAALQTLQQLGFTDVRAVGGEVGRASAIKMIRSVMVKGMEALAAEMILAADAAGVTEEVLASLNASWPGTDWAAKVDYNLERMLVHGLRRAEEMAEAAETLRGLGLAPAVTQGTIDWQQAMGELEIAPVPETLVAKLAAIRTGMTQLRKAAE